MLIDEIYYHILALPSYILMLAVLLATLFIGTEVNGAKSWLRLGGFSVQPAEVRQIYDGTRPRSLHELLQLFHGRLAEPAVRSAPAGGPHGRHPAPERRRFGHRVRPLFSSSSTAKVSNSWVYVTGDGGLPLRLLLPLEPCDAARGGHRYLYPSSKGS